VIYDSRQDAIRHQIHETQCMYLRVIPTLMTAAEATALVVLHRKAYAAGMRMIDPGDSPMMTSRGPTRGFPG
jgi:hypothetical protein